MKSKQKHSKAFERAMAKLDTMPTTADYINPKARRDKQLKYQQTRKYKGKNEILVIGENKNEYHKNYYQNNKEKTLAIQKEYYQNNKEKISECHKKWYQNNKEKTLAIQKEYYQNNKEKISECHKKWNGKNKEQIKEYHKKWYQNNKERIDERQKKYKQQKEILIIGEPHGK